MNNKNIKPIAFYLPQFHTIPENDKWWGEGFTEWVNVKRALPFFEGHNQPLEPLEQYDLKDKSVMPRQIKLAKEYGIHGFCFHYYWFKEKRLLEKPIENFLADKSEANNFPFMLCWANENWTRRWDGQDQDVLISQSHSAADHEKVIQDLLRYMKDDRYIKVNNKPILIIYRPNIIKAFNYLRVALNAEARKLGFDGVHIVASTAFNFQRSENFKVDGIVEFPPHSPHFQNEFAKITHERFRSQGFPEFKPEKIEKKHEGKIYDYQKVVDCFLSYYFRVKDHAKNYYPCCFPSWDNTARKLENSHIFANASSAKFKQWLSASAEFTKIVNEKDSQFVFINAWNEWAEGTILEPDKKNGYKNLEVVREVINE